MRGAPLDGWANGGSIDIFFTYCGYGLRSMESWSYSKEWVCNLRTKLYCLIQEFDIRYIML